MSEAAQGVTEAAPTSTAATDAPAQAQATSMSERMGQLRASREQATAKPTEQDSVSALRSDTEEPQSVDGAKLEGETAKAEKAKEQKAVPFPAFKERVDKLTARARQAEEAVATKDFEIQKAHEAVKLLASRLEELQSAMQEGRAFDPRDAEVGRLQLEQRAREAEARIRAQYEGTLAERQTEMEVSALREQLDVEITDATGRFPLVSREEIIAGMRRVPDASAESIAEKIHEDRLAKARGFLGTKPPPPAPTNVRTPGVAPSRAHPPTAEGLAARLRELKQARGQ